MRIHPLTCSSFFAFFFGGILVSRIPKGRVTSPYTTCTHASLHLVHWMEFCAHLTEGTTLSSGPASPPTGLQEEAEYSSPPSRDTKSTQQQRSVHTHLRTDHNMHAHTHAHMHACTHARMHTHIHMHTTAHLLWHERLDNPLDELDQSRGDAQGHARHIHLRIHTLQVHSPKERC